MNDDTTHYGLIAQEVSQSLSEFSVHNFGGYDDDGSYLSSAPLAERELSPEAVAGGQYAHPDGLFFGSCGVRVPAGQMLALDAKVILTPPCILSKVIH